MAGCVVHLARRSLDWIEDDVFVEAGDHPFRQSATMMVESVEPCACNSVFPRRDLVHAGDADPTERSGELVHPVVESRGRIVRLAVGPEETRELDQLRVSRDHHPTFTG